jgi:hypothetical protein
VARALATILCLLGLLAAAGPAAAAQPGFVQAVGQTVDGPAAARDLDARWVRLWLPWAIAEPGRGSRDPREVQLLRDEVAAYHAAGARVDVVLFTTPPWAHLGLSSQFAPPANPADYAAFARYAASAIPGVDAWELWNEEDGNSFWLDGPQVSTYTALLRAAYPAIKSVQPSDTVLVGGLVGQDVGFLNGIYADGGRGYFDAVAAHTDFACDVDDPGSYYREKSGWLGRFTFTGYRELHYVMAAHGDAAKPIWLTEIGWPTAPGRCARGAHAGAKAAGVGEAQQAALLARAYQCLAADPYVQVAIWFSLQDVDNGPQDDHHLGLIRTDGTHKPAYAAFRALQRGVAPVACGGVPDHTAPALTVSAPADGHRYVHRFAVRAAVSDAGAGTPVGWVQAYVDGVKRGSWKGTAVDVGAWGTAARLGYGPHTLTLRVVDAAGNVSSRTVTVVRVRHLAATLRTQTSLLVTRPATRVVSAVATVGYPADQDAPTGSVRVVFQRRAHHRWVTAQRRYQAAGQPFSLTQPLPRGRWRVYAYYTRRAPYRGSRSAYRFLTIR